MIRFSLEQLQRFKTPLGQLIPGGPSETMPRLIEIVEQSHPPRVITVGDVVSREARLAGVRVNLGIVDGKTMRKKYTPQSMKFNRVVNVGNPAGTITDEAWQAIRTAIKEDDVMIVVDGEEDLLAIPVTIEAPDGSLIVYGQPSEGIVVITATREKRSALRKLLDEVAGYKRTGSSTG